MSVYDEAYTNGRFLNHRVVNDIDDCRSSDVWVVTELRNPQACYERLVAELPEERVIVPRILGLTRSD